MTATFDEEKPFYMNPRNIAIAVVSVVAVGSVAVWFFYAPQANAKPEAQTIKPDNQIQQPPGSSSAANQIASVPPPIIQSTTAPPEADAKPSTAASSTVKTVSPVEPVANPVPGPIDTTDPLIVASTTPVPPPSQSKTASAVADTSKKTATKQETQSGSKIVQPAVANSTGQGHEPETGTNEKDKDGLKTKPSWWWSLIKSLSSSDPD